jgi:hypothetical protein
MEWDYWTLCGPMAARDGSLQSWCELTHMLAAGLIQSPKQFHGVEKNPTFHEANVLAVRKKYKTGGPQLHFGDIRTVMSEALTKNRLRPALVFLDTIHEPKRAVQLLGSVLHLLNHVEGPNVVVLNAVIDNPRYGRRYSTQQLAETVANDVWCMSQISNGWLDSREALEYDGTGHTATKMATLVFYRPYRQAALTG